MDTKMDTKVILLTGGVGFIGSHVLLSLLRDPHQCYTVVILDDLSNSNEESLRRVGELSARPAQIIFYRGDIGDQAILRKIFTAHPDLDLVINCAGLKSVSESNAIPLKYYHTNMTGTIVLLEMMQEFGITQFIFSSSATVYGGAPAPLIESSPTGAGITNAYGRSKYMIEEMLKDLVNAPLSDSNRKPWKVIILRYFNPIGADASGRIGEDPLGIPNNLMPYIAQVCIGKRPQLTVFGQDYDTKDGTGVRDYIHVSDLASGHVAAVQALENPSLFTSDPLSQLKVYNLGSGTGCSVLELVQGMERASGKTVKYQVGPRRTGDLATVVATPELARQELKWQTTKSIQDMCEDTWRWQQMNPQGFPEPTSSESEDSK